jgi:hypothetical protein
MTAFQVDDSDLPRPAAVWRCDGCECVHVRAGSTLLTFRAAEFAAFAESVNDCYWQLALRGGCELALLSTSLPQNPSPDAATGGGNKTTNQERTCLAFIYQPQSSS